VEIPGVEWVAELPFALVWAVSYRPGAWGGPIRKGAAISLPVFRPGPKSVGTGVRCAVAL